MTVIVVNGVKISRKVVFFEMIELIVEVKHLFTSHPERDCAINFSESIMADFW